MLRILLAIAFGSSVSPTVVYAQEGKTECLWCRDHLTGDLQIVENQHVADDTAIILGLRAKIDL